MMGYFFAVVGPSGAGKDSLMDGARLLLPSSDFVFAKRIVTRPPGQVGEDYESCPPAIFAQRQAQGEFLTTWQAHGFEYGLSATLRDHQTAGKHVLANCSRGALAALSQATQNLVVLHVWAEPSVLAERLKHRGRETAQEIEQRLSREAAQIPASLRTIRIANNTDLPTAIQAFVQAIQTTIASPSSQSPSPPLPPTNS